MFFGTFARNSFISCWVTIPPVGLFGVHTKIARVFGVIAFSIPAKSCCPLFVSGTWTLTAPAIVAMIGYASNDLQA